MYHKANLNRIMSEYTGQAIEQVRESRRAAVLLLMQTWLLQRCCSCCYRGCQRRRCRRCVAGSLCAPSTPNQPGRSPRLFPPTAAD